MGFTKHLLSVGWTSPHLSISPLSPYIVLDILAAIKSNSFSPALRFWFKLFAWKNLFFLLPQANSFLGDLLGLHLNTTYSERPCLGWGK